jgi:glycosyltransferase involved in cell wall biosynthesis
MVTDAAILTIVAKNYLPYARVLCGSFLAHHPEARAFVLLCDRNEGAFDPTREPFTLLEVEALQIPDFRAMSFKYDVMELSTAVKPYSLARLFEVEAPEKLLYLDPDILVVRPLTPIFEALDEYDIALTPHLTRSYDDDKRPSEIDILRSGVFNLGFLGLRRSASADTLLRWWSERCENGCITRQEAGYFVDQRWMDFAPSLFPNVGILRAPGYNVAYWNLHERKVAWGDDPRVNDDPLYFFHFSGFRVDAPEAISKHQDRFRLEQLPELAPLFEHYRELLLANGYEDCRGLPYHFGEYEDGTPVLPVERRLYWSMAPSRRAHFGNPFAPRSEPSSFIRWAESPADLTRYKRERRRQRRLRKRGAFGVVRALLQGRPWRTTNLMVAIHESAPEIREKFPHLIGADRLAFLRWFHRKGGGAYPAPPAEKLPAGSRVEKAAAPHRPAVRHPERGLHISGYFTTRTGVGESARSFVAACEAAQIPHSKRNIVAHELLPTDDDLSVDFSAGNPHSTNLVVVNADEAKRVARELGRRHLRRRYNIGFWVWELSEFPPEWTDRFALFDEVWTPSTHTAEAVQAAAPIPVLRMPYPVQPEIVKYFDRSDFGLDPDRFVFLFVFDFHSFFERKNPIALLHAFREAFGERARDDVELIVKSSSGGQFPEEMALLQREARGLSVRILDESLSTDQVRSLIRACDAYASLHRCEGFGLTLAEAMYFGKPTIATGYSGNLDFMRPDNSLLVRHELVELDRDFGPYRRGAVWAKPDVHHAAELMRGVVDDRAAARALGARARLTVERELSFASVGERMRRRLAAISR